MVHRGKRKKKESQKASLPNTIKKIKFNNPSSKHHERGECSVQSGELSQINCERNECHSIKRKRFHEGNGYHQNLKKTKLSPRPPTDNVDRESPILSERSEGIKLQAGLFCLIKYAEELMRKKFNEIVKPETLQEHLKKHRKSLKSLDEVQRKLLFPENGEVSSDNFDISTLYTLFRRTLNKVVPTKEWNVPPEDNDVSLGDDIERLHLFRNFVFHLPVNKRLEELNKSKEDILQVIRRLGGSVMNISQELDSVTIPNLKVGEDETHERESFTDDLEQKKWKEEDKLYFQTHSFKRIWKKIKRCKKMLVIGGPGIGKRALIRHCALKLQKQGFSVLPLTKPSEIKLFAKKEQKQVFLMDNLSFQGLMDNFLLDDSVILKDSFLNLHKDSIVLMTMLKDVYIRAKDHSRFLICHAGILDLDETQFSLNLNDKKGIFVNHSKGKENEIPSIDFSEVEGNCFPALVKMFCNTRKCQQRGIDFFHCPYEFYLKELKRIKNDDRIAYTALVVLLFQRNSSRSTGNLFTQILKKCEIRLCLESFLSLLGSTERLTGTYIIKNNGEYEFLNESIHDVIAYDFGKDNPELCIRYLSMEYVSSNILIGNKHKAEIPKIKVDKAHFPILANRLYDAVRNLEVLHAFRARCWLSELFSAYFIQFLEKRPFKEVKTTFWRKKFISSHEEKGEEITDIISQSFLELFDKELKPSSIPEILKVFLVFSNEETFDSDSEPIKFPTVKMWKLMAKGCSSEELATCFLKDCLGKACASKLRIVTWRMNVMRPIVAYGLNTLFCYLFEQNKKQKKSFYELFCPTEEDKRIMFYLGCLSGNRNIAETVINNVPKKNVKEGILEYGMYLACLSGSTGIVSSLIKEMRRHKLNYKGDNELLHVAYVLGDQKMIEMLRKMFQWYAFYDYEGNGEMTPLIAACSGGHENLVRELIMQGVNVNKCIEHGVSPLYQASVTGNLNIVKLLCENGANPKMRTSFDSTPLKYAKRHGHLDIVSYLRNLAIPQWEKRK